MSEVFQRLGHAGFIAQSDQLLAQLSIHGRMAIGEQRGEKGFGLQKDLPPSQFDGLGRWIRNERDVVADYKRVFKENPPNKPLYMRLWSDSDNTDSVAEVDFDNVILKAR